MEVYMYIIALMLIFGFKNAANNLTFTKLDGKHEPNFTFIEKEYDAISSSIFCAELCAVSYTCFSFGYLKSTSKCTLMTEILDETVVQGMDFGWNYFVTHDRCRPSWIQYDKSCYNVETYQRTFHKAMHDCGAKNAHLIYINDVQENTFVRSLIDPTGQDNFWIGLSDEVMEGTWRWYPSFIQANFTIWDDGEPNSGRNENCGLVHKVSMKWHDAGCSSQFSFICETEVV